MSGDGKVTKRVCLEMGRRLFGQSFVELYQELHHMQDWCTRTSGAFQSDGVEVGQMQKKRRKQSRVDQDNRTHLAFSRFDAGKRRLLRSFA